MDQWEWAKLRRQKVSMTYTVCRSTSEERVSIIQCCNIEGVAGGTHRSGKSSAGMTAWLVMTPPVREPATLYEPTINHLRLDWPCHLPAERNSGQAADTRFQTHA